MDEYEEEDKEYPFWGRVAIGLAVLFMGACAGWLIAESWTGALWGSILASPVGLLGFAAPRAMAAILVVFQVFSCVS
ncbi:hypothetical protein GXW78_27190 [Roseomonas terrae]|uniref:Uncharacterized protein n=1 Tax=Neoroseomonas terrae TaxID=424799 RepID=A0ABS5EQQ6_9PROT|nr:hypothetical protein [Neoroseomonas terrae]MBR0653366.1 hypothetical protein [Neoroseomonas terrae]